jgi:hypothetical protein
LIRYEQQLEAAVRADLARRRRRRLAGRVALACSGAAAVALGALSVFGHGSTVVRPASAESVVRRSLAALAHKPDTILHVRMLGSQQNGDGSTVSWSDESWQAESPPYGRRAIQIGTDGSKVESTSDTHGEQVYDSATNTIYVGPRPAAGSPEELNRPHLLPGLRPGTFILRVGPARRGALTLVITAAQARAFRAGTLGIGFKLGKPGGSVDDAKLVLMPIQKRPGKTSPSRTPDPWSPAFRDQILELLSSGGARVVGHKTIDGRETIEISSDDGHTVYFVDPGNYQPVELDTHGTDGGTELRFRVYELLPIAGNGDLLSLAAQHPTARVDRKVVDYQAAQARLFPHG